MKFVFGPLPSRRLGQSLGVDPLPSKVKVCNWNCVYCQLGRTVPLSNERSEYFPRESILAEVREALAGHKPGAIDWVTLVGSGETTLHSGIGWLIRQIKALTSIPVASVKQALKCVRWYRRRWRIEEWHRVMKSGCKILNHQNHRAQVLLRAIALDAVIAWRIMLLTLLGRTVPGLPCDLLFNPCECAVLALLAQKKDSPSVRP